MSVADVIADTALLERDDALQLLAEELAVVGDKPHAGRVVLVAGEAGIGKTELLRRFAAETGRGTRVLWAACDVLHTPRPMGPLLDIAEVTGGELADRIADAAPPQDVSAALLSELSKRSPTVLIVEDAHWADEATVDVLRLVARRVDSVSALVIVSYRKEQLDLAHPLRVLLGELPSRRVSRLALEALSVEAVEALAAPAGIDGRKLHARTGGNPFFVTEVLATGGEEIPETVRDAVLARAARLDDDARVLLEAVAVVPDRAELWLLDALGELVSSRVDQCVASGMLTADASSLVFRHELARLAILDAIRPDRGFALHRAVLGALASDERRSRQLARLAHHAEAADDVSAVLEYAPAAAAEAAALQAHREAAAQYGRALRAAGTDVEPARRAELLEGYAAACYLTDLRHDALTALDEALEIHRKSSDVPRQVDLLRRRVNILICAGRNDEARADLKSAADLLRDDPHDEELARVYAAQSSFAMNGDEVEEAIAVGQKVIDIAERLGDAPSLTASLTNVGSAQLLRGDWSGLEKIERTIALSDAKGLGPEVGRAYINATWGLARRRRPEAKDYVLRGIEYCRDNGLEAWNDCLQAQLADIVMWQGDYSQAVELADVVMVRAPQPTESRFRAQIVIGLVRARRGDPKPWEMFDGANGIAESAGTLQYLGPLALVRAEAAWLEGRPEAVGQETDRAFAIATAVREPWMIAQLAYWRKLSGIEDDLSQLELEGPFADQLAGRDAVAAEAWDRLNCPYERALALADTSDEGAMRAALDALRELGANAAAAIVSRRLRETGARDVPRGPIARTRENLAGLTRRELEVLRLVAEGMTNAEIAARLVLAEKTVAHHVSALLRKLDVENRAKAVVEAGRMGILGAGER